MKPTGFHCGSIRQWRKNGVENLTDLQGKKATTTQAKMNDNRHDQRRSCLLFCVIKIFELVTICGKLLMYDNVQSNRKGMYYSTKC